MTAPLETLRRVTRDMAVTPELSVLLNSIASVLAEHTGASFVRVFLYQTDDECDICRARGKVEPATTSVTLLGGASSLETLKPEQFRIVLDREDLRPRLELPDSLKGKVSLKSIQTSKFVPVK